MDKSIRKLTPKEFPELLKEIDDPPRELYLKGELPEKDRVFLCVVGSRKVSPYGKRVCLEIIEKLAGYKIAIVSGLALGIDAEAHTAALDANLPTVAIPGSGLNKEVLYPRSNLALAERIINSGGVLLSEFEPDFKATKWSFPKRNRIMAGMSHCILVVEAEIRSGSLITARLGLEYNRDVCAVPGSILSAGSSGTNYLIREGAFPITSAEDLINVLKPKREEKRNTPKSTINEKEKELLKKISSPVKRNRLIEESGLSAPEVNTLISSLELKGVITESGGVIYPKIN